MHYIKPTPAAIGPAFHTPLDMERLTRLPANQFRQLPGPTDRWARLAREGSVTLLAAEIWPAGKMLPDDATVEDSGVVILKGDPKRYIREEDVEGYEAPPPSDDKPKAAEVAQPTAKE